MRPIILILCNAFEDSVRQDRCITTDSPAASKKLFMLSKALLQVKVTPFILSLGRGQCRGKFNFFSSNLPLQLIFAVGFCYSNCLRINISIHGIFFNKFSSWRYFVAHKHREHSIGFSQTINCNLTQCSVIRVHCCFP